MQIVEARRVSVKINEDDRVDLHDLWDRFDKSLCGELDESQLKDMLQSMGACCIPCFCLCIIK